MQQPEAYIGNIGSILDEQGTIINKDSHIFLEKFMTSFAQWVDRVKAQ